MTEGGREGGRDGGREGGGREGDTGEGHIGERGREGLRKRWMDGGWDGGRGSER